MKILITGGAGFIASNLVDNLISQGHGVQIIDNLVTGKKENINPKATFFKEDICNEEGLDKIFSEEKADIVNHHAAQVDLRRSVKEPLYDAQDKYTGVVKGLDWSPKAKLQEGI